MVEEITHISSTYSPPDTVAVSPSVKQPADGRSQWTKGTCPNCGYMHADVDVEGVLWCPACGYSKKACYT